MDDYCVLLGIDIGSVSISVAEIKPKREIGKTAYQFHHGNIAETLTRIMNDFDPGRICGIAAILVVGGEAFGLIGFDEKGHYRNFRTNTSCAAGTGSFLDQQARRLNLQSAEALSEKAFSNRGSVPKIASRCAVFAKTDLVHAQQEGYTLKQICDGFCYLIETPFLGKEYGKNWPCVSSQIQSR